jgi:hypothetical protein
MNIDISELLQMIKKQQWTEAKTYRDTAPHEYIIANQNEPLFRAMKYLIQYYGFYREFKLYKTKQTYRYFYIGEYSYWIMSHVLNRCKLDGSFIRLF